MHKRFTLLCFPTHQLYLTCFARCESVHNSKLLIVNTGLYRKRCSLFRFVQISNKADFRIFHENLLICICR